MSRIPIRHRSLHVAITEPPEGGRKDCTVFFIHGAMASLEQWRFQIHALRNHFRVVSFDYFGCGNSPRLENSWESYSTEEHLADLLALFDQEKTKYNVVIGHSFGCSQALRVANLRGDDVISGVLVAPAVMKDGGHPIFYLPEFILKWIQPALSKNVVTLALHPQTREGKTEAHRELLNVAERRSNTNSMHVAKSFYRQIKFIREDVVVGIKGSIPFLVICGSDDKLTPISMAETIISWLNKRQNQTEFAKPRLEIAGPASHQVMEEQPELVNQFILEFLNSVMPFSSSSALGST